MTVDGKAYAVEFKGDRRSSTAKPTRSRHGRHAAPAAAAPAPAASVPEAPAAAAGGDTEIAAPVPGIILRITAQAGQAIKAGDEILVMEAMKMEMPIKAPSDGTVASILVAQAQKINTGDILARLA